MLPGSAAILLMGLRCALAVDFCENWEVNMSQNTPALDYLAPNVSEMTQQRGGVGSDPLNSPKEAQDQMTRTVARRLIHACVVTPPLLWWVLFFGVHRGWMSLDTSFIVFVYSVTVVFGAIVFINLKKLSTLEEQSQAAQEQLQAGEGCGGGGESVQVGVFCEYQS